MSVSKIVRHFEGLGQVPVQMDDVVTQFRRLMPNDTLKVTGVDLPASVLRGAHYRYTHQPHPASALQPVTITQIIYSLQQPLEWQRLVLCKELIHVFDNTGVETDQPQEVLDLVRKLSGAEPKVITSGTSLHWFFDELAEYQAMALLFPFSLREELNGSAKADRANYGRIAQSLELPVNVVEFVMLDAWKHLRQSILIS